jgi:multiple sugar transport system ATP-binding protein
MSYVRLKNVWKRFATTEVIKGIDLDLDEGEFVVLVRPSGCGKSTLLNLVAGLETPSDGDIFIGDTLMNDVPPKDRNIAMVFQSYALYPTKTVHKNITFGMETQGIPAKDQDEALKQVSELLHVEALLERKPGQLSGGQRQRVAMGQALVRNPDLASNGSMPSCATRTSAARRPYRPRKSSSRPAEQIIQLPRK